MTMTELASYFGNKSMNPIPIFSRDMAEKSQKLRASIIGIRKQALSPEKEAEKIEELARDFFTPNEKQNIMKIRPRLERIGLTSMVKNVLPQMEHEKGRKFQQQMLITGQCITCLKENKEYNPSVKKIVRNEFLNLEDFIKQPLAYLGKDEELRSNDLPDCLIHHDISMGLLSSVHRIISDVGNKERDLDDKNLTEYGQIFDMRIKSGYEMIKKLTDYFFGERDEVADSVAWRTMVQDKEYVPHLVNVLSNWNPDPRGFPLTESVAMLKSQNKIYRVGETEVKVYDLRALIDKEYKEPRDESTQEIIEKIKKEYIFESRGITREVKINNTTQEIPVGYAEAFTPLDMRGNLVNGFFYPIDAYSDMEQQKRYSALEYNQRKLEKQLGTWLEAKWIFSIVLAENTGQIHDGHNPVLTGIPDTIFNLGKASARAKR